MLNTATEIKFTFVVLLALLFQIALNLYFLSFKIKFKEVLNKEGKMLQKYVLFNGQKLICQTKQMIVNLRNFCGVTIVYTIILVVYIYGNQNINFSFNDVFYIACTQLLFFISVIYYIIHLKEKCLSFVSCVKPESVFIGRKQERYLILSFAFVFSWFVHFFSLYKLIYLPILFFIATIIDVWYFSSRIKLCKPLSIFTYVNIFTSGVFISMLLFIMR